MLFPIDPCFSSSGMIHIRTVNDSDDKFLLTVHCVGMTLVIRLFY